MAAENHPTELQQDEINVQTTTTPKNDLISFENPPSTEIDELNQRIRNDLINYCSSFVEDDEEARLYMQRVWKKYLHYVGDVPMVEFFAIFVEKKTIFFLFLFVLAFVVLRHIADSRKKIGLAQISRRDYAMV